MHCAGVSMHGEEMGAAIIFPECTIIGNTQTADCGPSLTFGRRTSSERRMDVFEQVLFRGAGRQQGGTSNDHDGKKQEVDVTPRLINSCQQA